jgi:ATP-dependent DNA helicase RecG
MDIEELIERGESQDLEFKESPRLKDEIGETVSAFSNSDGGTVVVGVSNSSSELRKLAKESGEKVYWDERVCEDASLEDIEEDKVRWFLKEARNKRGLDINEDSPVGEALLRLKLLKAGKPANGAVLLFAKDPQRRFIQSEVKCIRFKGVGVTGEMIDLRTVDGDVFDQLIEAEKFIFNNIALSAWIEEGKIQRQERWEYPPKAIREALANKKILIQRGTSKKLTYYELSV